MDEQTVNSIPDRELLRRVIWGARTPHGQTKQPRWVAVHHLTGLGSTYSCQLCRRYGLDPSELV